MENPNKKQIIRNIPIYVEGRDEPIDNSNAVKNSSNIHNETRSENKIETVQQKNVQPVPVVQEEECDVNKTEPLRNNDHQQHLLTSIDKIHSIQESVISLMSKVELFDGQNEKEYKFLDEMLTQNLLKLDNIDVDGKENVKNARKEAIKCINSLINLLDTKKEEFLNANKSSK